MSQSTSSARALSRRELLGAAAGLSALGLTGCAPRGAGGTSTGLAGASTPLAPLRLRPSAARGHADHGWLDTYHTFSFANYRDPAHERFGPLRVINQDRVTPGRGFPMHGHRDMEIVSYVLAGEMAHEDTMGNGSVIRPGDVQLMSAGRGVRHSEFNASDAGGLHFLQMWVLPARSGGEPRYEQRAFSRAERTGRLRQVVSPDGQDGSLTIGQDARLFAGLFRSGDAASHVLSGGRGAWLHVASGSLRAQGQLLGPGDGAALTGAGRVELEGVGDAEFVLWDVPHA